MCCDYVVFDYRVWALEGIDTATKDNFSILSADVRIGGISYHDKFDDDSNTWDVLVVGKNTSNNVDNFESEYRRIIGMGETPLDIGYSSKSVSQEEAKSLVLEFSGFIKEVQSVGFVSTGLEKDDYVPLDKTATITEKVEQHIFYKHGHSWFTTQEVQKSYEMIYGYIKLSTVSTYFSRMYRKNLLSRRGNRTQREYCLIRDNWDLETGIPIDKKDRIKV